MKIKLNPEFVRKKINAKISQLKQKLNVTDCNDFFANCCNCCDDGGCCVGHFLPTSGTILWELYWEFGPDAGDLVDSGTLPCTGGGSLPSWGTIVGGEFCEFIPQNYTIACVPNFSTDPITYVWQMTSPDFSFALELNWNGSCSSIVLTGSFSHFPRVCHVTFTAP